MYVLFILFFLLSFLLFFYSSENERSISPGVGAVPSFVFSTVTSQFSERNVIRGRRMEWRVEWNEVELTEGLDRVLSTERIDVFVCLFVCLLVAPFKADVTKVQLSSE